MSSSSVSRVNRAALLPLFFLLLVLPLPLAAQEEILPQSSGRSEALDVVSSGLAAKDRGDLNGAIRRFTHALNSGELDEENQAITLNNRGNCYADQEKWEQALRDYNQAILIFPAFSEAYFNRAGICYQTGNFKQAAADYQEAISHNPRLPQPHYRLSLVWARLGDYTRAMEEAQQAVNLNPVSQPYRQWLTQCQQALREPGEK
jgi:tetratricopeptide (TPR) repeat protein